MWRGLLGGLTLSLKHGKTTEWCVLETNWLGGAGSAFCLHGYRHLQAKGETRDPKAEHLLESRDVCVRRQSVSTGSFLKGGCGFLGETRPDHDDVVCLVILKRRSVGFGFELRKLACHDQSTLFRVFSLGIGSDDHKPIASLLNRAVRWLLIQCSGWGRFNSLRSGGWDGNGDSRLALFAAEQRDPRWAGRSRE